ncbi:MAG: hypothetical protein ACD_79C00287G0003 [uncultured bacterium]|nr:MAG: hypothetical protein ACD_79C00287G0003 [uncultured bacterium]
MCGICGITGSSNKDTIRRMVSALKHRGPDDSGVYADDNVQLGMTRLAILDISPAGHQPMSNDNNTVYIVYNGELYNFKEQRQILEKKGISFRSHSDTEVVLKMYEEYGHEFLSKMRGMFALAIYDKRKGKNELLLARDPFGIKPLLYSQSNKSFIFASELKALLADSELKKNPDFNALAMLLVKGSIPQPRTMISNVFMLLPGHSLTYIDGKIKINRYWDFNKIILKRYDDCSYDEIQQQAASVIRESVISHMVSDVPVGAFLSGGVDSSLIVALMAKYAGGNINTFSVGFESESSAIDETNEAGKIAAILGTNHKRIQVSGIDVKNRIRHFIKSLDQPSVDGLNTYLISMAASKYTKVSISGTGGDELFMGYPWFKQMIMESGNNENNFAIRYSQKFRIFGGDETLKLINNSIMQDVSLGELFCTNANQADELSASNIVNRLSVLCLRSYTQNQLLRDIDAVSMAHSLEIRVPFLDTEVLNLSLSLPSYAKINSDTSSINPYTALYSDTGAKKILIDINNNLLKMNNISNQPKRGFNLPIKEWLLGELKDVYEEALSEKSVRTRGVFDFGVVNRIKEDFKVNKISYVKPWLLFVTEMWLRENLDN